MAYQLRELVNRHIQDKHLGTAYASASETARTPTRAAAPTLTLAPALAPALTLALDIDLDPEPGLDPYYPGAHRQR